MLARAQRKTLPGTMPLVPGQAVEALWPEDGEWYNAVVRAVTNKGIELDYEDGDFRAAIQKHGMCTCLTEDVWTTFKARTFLQPQFQKAVLSSRLQEEADMGPKDHLIVPEGCVFLRTTRDTTGDETFVNQPLPTKQFPSDHAIVTTEVLL